MPDINEKMPDSADEVPDTTGKVPDSADKVPDNVQEIYKYVLEKGFIVHYNRYGSWDFGSKIS